MFRLYCAIIGYALGCLQSAFIVGKLMGKIDIRDYGSGNAGFTNTARVLGKKAGIIVFVCDLLKVILAYIICSIIFKGNGSFTSGGTSLLPGVYGAIGCILGHIFPFYMGFKGGKGIACSLGLMLCLDWKVALISYLVGIIVVCWKKYISLASLSMQIVYPITLLIFHFDIEVVLLMFVLCILTYVKHIANIKRLINGTESKFGFKKAEK